MGIRWRKIYKIDLSNYSNFWKTYWEPYNIGFLEDENDFYCENNYLYIKSTINPSTKFGKIKFVSRNNLVVVFSNFYDSTF